MVVEQSVTTLQQQKQALFLPDLVPNVVTASQPPAPLPTESESDEYESADEQPLHGTFIFFFPPGLEAITPPLGSSGLVRISGFEVLQLLIFLNLIAIRHALFGFDGQSAIVRLDAHRRHAGPSAGL